MVGGPPDLVDCERLAADRVKLDRVYPLGDLPRLQDLLADGRGHLRASFEFARAESGRAGATVAIEATPLLVCQRCMDGFQFRVAARSQVEFAPAGELGDGSWEREIWETDQGAVSLRDLAEEELLLALPLAPACSSPARCGKAPPAYAVAPDAPPVDVPKTVRPFGGLRDLMKKQDRT